MLRFHFLVFGFVLLCHNVAEASPELGEKIDFSRDVRPILAEYCFQCHGPDSAARQAGLRLDQRDSATSEQESGDTAIVPGNALDSQIVLRLLQSDEELRMPPAETNNPVPREKIEILKRWIDDGAVYSDHWSFVSVTHPTVPESASGATLPIDAFVQSKLEAHGWHPSPPAPRRMLIRRLSLDLRGLPPSPEEVRQYLDDRRDGATERLIDRLMGSPQFGERMATIWLDGARYADTNGYQNDFNRTMWPYRDWVIRAFNKNMPFDQFVVEQIAGDLLPDATNDQRIASGFNRNHRTVTEAGSLEQEWLVENVIDRVETTGTVFLGLTIGCARCHDHKFDPISQTEFYQFFDFFHQIDELGVYTEKRGNVEPKVSLTNEEQDEQLKEWLAEARQLEDREEPLKKQADVAYSEWVASGGSDEPTPADVLRFPLDGSRKGREDNVETPLRLHSRVEPTTEDGQLGPTLVLSGEQWLDCDSTVFSPEFDRPFSLSVWARPENMGAIVSKMEKPGGFRGFDVLPFAGLVSVHMIHQWPDDVLKVVTSEKLSADSINHLVVTYDGSQKASGMRVYFNGVETKLTAEKDGLSATIANDIPLQIGRRSGGDFFQGSIHDLRFFDRVLSPEEICGLVIEKLKPIVIDGGSDDESLKSILHRAYVHHGPDDDCREFSLAKRRRVEVEKSRKAMLEKLTTSMVMKEREDRRDTFVLMRGSYDRPDKDRKVSAQVPACLPPLPDGAPRNRLGLARWLVAPENPLTARVFANRMWEQLFGLGIVESSENFGYRGDLPSHPRLLDYLAAEFVRSGWDVKSLIRLIVMSETYQQTSAVSAELYQRDPGNRWLARGARFRLPAEFVRDNALAISGLLSTKIGGPSVKPYQPEGLWEELAGGANGGPYVLAKDENLYRRSLYTFRKRTVPHPTLTTFDAPSWEICQVKRAVTNTPLQALALLNDVTYLEAARKLAEWMLTNEDADDDANRIAAAFEKCTSRLPSPAELQSLERGLAAFEQRFAGGLQAKEFISHGQSQADPDLDVQRLASFTALASTLLNLDETITKE